MHYYWALESNISAHAVREDSTTLTSNGLPFSASWRRVHLPADVDVAPPAHRSGAPTPGRLGDVPIPAAAAARVAVVRPLAAFTERSQAATRCRALDPREHGYTLVRAASLSSELSGSMGEPKSKVSEYSL